MENLETLIKRWIAFCIVQSACHETCYNFYKSTNLGLMVPAYLLGSLSSIGTISSSTNTKCSTEYFTNWITVGFALASVLSSALLSIQKFVNFADLQKEHEFYCDMFASLANDAELNMSLINTNDQIYANVEEFAKHFKRQMDNLLNKAPMIPPWVKKKHAHSQDSSIQVQLEPLQSEGV